MEPPLLGVEVVAHGHEREGEIFVRGRNVMVGFLHKVEKTHQSVFLATGDLGSKAADTSLVGITGRLKPSFRR